MADVDFLPFNFRVMDYYFPAKFDSEKVRNVQGYRFIVFNKQTNEIWIHENSYNNDNMCFFILLE